ncbi:MAG: response regulator [Desulfobacterales bacterium]|jgi:DNA-binding NtrC family response regulator|nr:response regulator [Desulfobacterales bacterium]
MTLKALVIDDEQIVLDSVKKILAAEKFDVDTTLSGTDGIEKALNHTYDIVLTDIRMPGVGGLIVLRDIKRARPSMPVIIITGYGSVRSAVQAMKLGAADYIEKPFEPAKLVEAITNAVSAAKNVKPDKQKIIHREEIVKVLEMAAVDEGFRQNLIQNGADALDDFNLTGAEKLALMTGDVKWIDSEMGPLNPRHKEWLESRLGAEVW